MGDVTHSYWGCVPGGAVESPGGLEVPVRVARPDAACPRGRPIKWWALGLSLGDGCRL